jgi:predicted ATPase
MLDAALVLPTLAHAFDLREAGPRTAGELVADHIGQRRMLLVLDSVEQVIEAGVAIAERLFLSPCTVAAHLRRICRKLAISSRAVD